MTHEDPRGQARREPTEAPREPTEEELRAAFEEQMRRLRVEDLLLQTVVTLVNLAGRRLGLGAPPEAAGEKDLDQARQAIEATRALVPLLPAEAGPVRDALSQLQVAYAREAGAAAARAGAGGAGEAAGRERPAEAGEGAAPGRAEPGAEAAAEEGEPSADDRERERARAKIWTPPGS